MEGSPAGDQRGDVADPGGGALAGSAGVLWALEDGVNRHRRWSADGTWEKILDGLRAGCDVAEGAEWELSVDATVIRAHHHAAGARHDPPKDVPAERLAPTVLEGIGAAREAHRGRRGMTRIPSRPRKRCQIGRHWAVPAAGSPPKSILRPTPGADRWPG